jgi:hypothetical protein
MKLIAHLYLMPRLKICAAIPLLHPYIFMVWYLVKHTDNFIFYEPYPKCTWNEEEEGEEEAKINLTC